jgi:uncharacterized protein YbaR (Trm112 family)
MLNKELLDILACPQCKKGIVQQDEELICQHCQKAYPIKEGIPVMLIEKARDLKII